MSQAGSNCMSLPNYYVTDTVTLQNFFINYNESPFGKLLWDVWR